MMTAIQNSLLMDGRLFTRHLSDNLATSTRILQRAADPRLGSDILFP
jgi:hypothetical protein